MVTDEQVRRLLEMDARGMDKETAAARAGMCPKTARKYRRAGKLPSETKKPHTWRTRRDPFKEQWPGVREQLELNPGLYATTLFEHLQRMHPGKFQDGQLRTFQRRVRHWRATEGPPREVFFSQVHEPGRLCASDFTDCGALGVTIVGRPFEHKLYHFTLTYSNWEWARVCFSETLEALSEGLQEALWKLGGVPQAHRTDQLSSAVNVLSEKKRFTERYGALISHYGLEGQKTNPASPHENGDVEKRHDLLKRRIDQALMLRGSRDFESRESYEEFLCGLLEQLNRGRSERLAREREVLGRLPTRRLPAFKEVRGVRVSKGSLIRVDRNRYSVPSRLIGQKVDVRVRAERLDIYYGRQKLAEVPRLSGRGKVRIDYRHVIDWLVRKPGALEGYRYREELFPTSRFRMAYDELKARYGRGGAGRYARILELAARQSESGVDRALRELLGGEGRVSVEAVERHLEIAGRPESPPPVRVEAPDLAAFDRLLSGEEAGR